MRWLFDLFLQYQENYLSTSLESSTTGAFSQSSFLRLLRRILEHQWKSRDFYKQTFLNLKQLSNHPYHIVRNQMALVFMSFLSNDVKYGQDANDISPEFPTVKQYLDEVLPILNKDPTRIYDITKQIKSISINVEDNSNKIVDKDAQKKSKECKHHVYCSCITVAVWIKHYSNFLSISIPKEIYQILPFLFQFVENEEIYKNTLEALSSFAIKRTSIEDLGHVLETVLEFMISSDSRKAKLNCLEFLQDFLSTNFMSLSFNGKFVRQIEIQILAFMADPRLQVRVKASKICCGLIHWGFFHQETVLNKLLEDFHYKISHNSVQNVKKTVQHNRKTSIEFKRQASILDCDELANYHCGILGLCAIIEAHPYDIPGYVPGLLMELAKHLHDPQPIPKTVKDTFQEFKRTHQDNWQDHKLKFTDDQLMVLNDLLISPNYYA